MRSTWYLRLLNQALMLKETANITNLMKRTLTCSAGVILKLSQNGQQCFI